MSVVVDWIIMKRLIFISVFFFAILVSIVFVTPCQASSDDSAVLWLTYSGAIQVISQEIIVDAIDMAEDGNYECLVIELDTPGGLETSMRSIIKRILSAEVPVVVYVSPSGSQAASAGAIITLSAQVAAMAPGTNIGAAHPVNMDGRNIDGTMGEKMENDAAAFARSLAWKTGRNTEWAERVVRESISSTEEEALKENVIELIADDPKELLEKLDGMKVNLQTGEYLLETKNKPIERMDIPFRLRFLSHIVNPSISYILLMIGIYGIYFELANPGAIFPGIIGVVSMLLAFLAFHYLPVNYVGIGLILLAMVLFTLEFKFHSYGLLTIGGVGSMLLGSIMMIDSSEDVFRLSLSIIAPFIVFSIVLVLVVATLVIRAYRRKAVTGIEGMVGEVFEIDESTLERGMAKLHGEYWRFKPVGEVRIGDTVKVTGVEGLVLQVERVVD